MLYGYCIANGIAQPMNVQFNAKAWGTGATTPQPARHTNLNQ
jgi:hypothetical protein